MRSRSRSLASVAPVFCLTWLLGALWALATPVMGAPDEPAHVVRAASVVRGQAYVTSTIRRHGDEVDSARIPETLAWPEMPCFAQSDLAPDCDVAPRGRGDVLVEVENRVANYNPAYYAVVGVPTLFAPGKSTIYVMRLLTALLVAALVGMAALALAETRAPLWALVGLAAALTPMVLFLAGSVNPNAVEIAAAVALWATLSSWFSTPDRALDRSRAVRAGVAATALVVSRPLSPVFLVLIVAGSLLVLERGALARVLRAGRVAAVVVGAIGIAALAWTFGARSLPTGSDVEHPEYESLGAYLGAMLSSFSDFEREMIGVFGWLDAPAEAHVYTVWFAILGFLVVAALCVGRARERLLLLGLLVLTVAFPLVVQYPEASTLGIIWQGRYLLPLMVGVPLVAGTALAANERWSALLSTGWSYWVPAGTLGALQVAAFWSALHDSVIGFSEPWIGFEPRWQPPLGWMALTLAYAVATGAWVVSLSRLALGANVAVSREPAANQRPQNA